MLYGKLKKYALGRELGPVVPPIGSISFRHIRPIKESKNMTYI